MRNIGLDLLRLVACLLVLVRHFPIPDYYKGVLKPVHCGGWVGVDLFFVLSGYLISTLLFKEYMRKGSIDTGRFLIRRGFKIYPALWALLLFSAFHGPVNGAPWPTAKQWLGELLFLQNYWGGVWNHTWSLAVEEHFYIGIALIFMILGRQQGHDFKFIPALFITLALTCQLMRILNWMSVKEYSHFRCLFGTHLRIDSLMFGVLLAYLIQFRDFGSTIAKIPSIALIGFGLLLLSPAFVFDLEEYRWVSVFGVVLFYLGSGSVLLGMIRLKESRVKLLTLLAFCGAASYSIYLWHMLVIVWSRNLLFDVAGIQSLPAYFITYVACSIGLGVLMNKIVELPVLKIREYFYPAR